MKKVLAICSGGGHWIQMQRIFPAFEGNELFIATVDKSVKNKFGDKCFLITDANFDTKIKLVISFFNALKIIAKVRPDVVISTGAAPGFWGILWGRFFKAKTIWLDSIANSGRLSLSGRLAIKVADEVLTQWAHLEGEKVKYVGSII